MSFGYVIRPKADQEIDSIADELAERGGIDMGLRFLSEIYETFAFIVTQPAMGWPCNVANPQLALVRNFRVSERFADYLIFYQPHGTGIEIVRIIHGSQDLVELFKKDGAFD